jgi:ribosomal 30S subunit maturation factor RimM
MGIPISIGQVREGFHVRTADNQDLGKVQEILVGTGDEGSYLHVRQGLFIKRDLYVPWAQVVAVEQGTVRLGLTKEEVSAHPEWHMRPAVFR